MFCDLFRRHPAIQETPAYDLHILSDFDNMLIGIISANASLSPRMFYNRVDIFNITLLQLISKLVKVVFLKIMTNFSLRNFSDSYAVLG